MDWDLTRRDLIKVGGASAAGLTFLGCDEDASSAGQPKPVTKRGTPPANPLNVVLVIMDSLRTDHIYGRRARTDSWNGLLKDGLRFTRAYPEGMPTIPARRSIMEGHRVYPFRGWRPFKGLTAQPGLGASGLPPPDVARVPPGAGLDHRLRDGQPAHRLLRARQDAQALRPAGADLRPGAGGAQGRPRRVQGGGLQVPPPVDPGHPRRAPHGGVPALQPPQPARGGVPRRARVRPRRRLAPVGAHAPALRAGGGLLRRARALGRPALAGRHLRHPHHAGGGADPAVPHAGRPPRGPRASRVRSCAACPTSTPPR